MKLKYRVFILNQEIHIPSIHFSWNGWNQPFHGPGGSSADKGMIDKPWRWWQLVRFHWCQPAVTKPSTCYRLWIYFKWRRKEDTSCFATDLDFTFVRRYLRQTEQRIGR